jgi:serine/threonine-protein kinase
VSGPLSGSGPHALRDSSLPLPSISETMSSRSTSPTDTDMAAVRTPNKGRTYVWGGVAVAVALGVGVVVVFWSGAKGSSLRDTPGAGSTAATTAPSVVVAPPPIRASTAAPTPAPVVPLIRQVRVESEPNGASVSEGDTQLCTSTPCELTWKDEAARADHKLQINKKGYRTLRITVGSADEKVNAKLEGIPVVQPAPPPPLPTSGRPLYKKDI